MRYMTHRKTLNEEASAEAPKPAAPQPLTARTTTVIWAHGTPVCVEIIDSPAPAPRDGVCRCAACHAAEYADWAEHFLP